MADYISTYTGIHFYPAQPDAEGICIEDIAHALSYLCRGNGHVSKYWSVAQHCILCAREAAAREWPDRLVLACLLHDASECYLSDVPRPFKSELTGYREHEERLLQMIYVRYLGSPLTDEERRMVREIDDGALFYDLKELLHNEQSEEDPQFHVVPSYEEKPFAEVEKEYLGIFYYYCGKVCGTAAGCSGDEGDHDGTGSCSAAVELITRAPERPAPDYALLAEQLREFAVSEPALMPLLANASALLKEAMAQGSTCAETRAEVMMRRSSCWAPSRERPHVSEYHGDAVSAAQQRRKTGCSSFRMSMRLQGTSPVTALPMRRSWCRSTTGIRGWQQFWILTVL